MFKNHLRMFAILVPLVVVARYMLFKDGAEFQRFFLVLKTYVAPASIALAVVMIGSLLYVVMKKVETAKQQRLVTIYCWAGSIFGIVSFLGAFAYTKLGV